MKKILMTMMLTFAVMAGFAIDPVELKVYKNATYNCAYFDWWYFGYSEAARFGFSIYDADHKEVAFTLMSMEETDMCAYYDNANLPKEQYEDRDDEAHYYMSTYWVLNSPNGVLWGGGDATTPPPACVYENSDTQGSSLFALMPGKYYFRVTELYYNSETGKASMGSGYAECVFEIKGTTVSNLKAEVSEDKKTATITWDEPKIPYGTHLYVSVQTGSDVAFDNYAQSISPKSPLTVPVIEGRTYSVTAQYINAKKEPQGAQVKHYFSVGENPYIPTNPNATVSNDDIVLFTWSANAKADYYHIIVYQGGATYASFTATEQQLTKQLPSGTYTWAVAAYEKDDELYYPMTEYVKGNEFTTKSAPLPEGTIELNIWGMEAFYMEDYAENGRYPWLITFESGTKNGDGLPEAWIIVWSSREFALSGSYSDKLGNIEMSTDPTEGSMMNINGQQSGLSAATSVSLKLEFDGFDSEYVMEGYSIPYYSGEFLMTCANGNTYHGTINQLICGPYKYDTSFSRSVLYSMFEEDGSAPYIQGIESVQDSTASSKTMLENGQVVIVREGVKYNVMGVRIN